MIRLLAALALLALSACAQARPSPGDAAVLLSFTDGDCSGTAVAAHTVLTATHCVVGGPLVSIDGLPARIVAAVHDGRDHSLVRVTTQFATTVPVRATPVLEQGTRVRYWGNPNNAVHLYREGYVMGSCLAEVCLASLPKVPHVSWGGMVYELSTPGWMGDSGSGVFNDRGEVIGVVSAIKAIAPTLQPMIVFPFAFTPEQWRFAS